MGPPPYFGLLLLTVMAALTVMVGIEVYHEVPATLGGDDLLCAGMFGCQPISALELGAFAAFAVTFLVLMHFGVLEDE